MTDSQSATSPEANDDVEDPVESMLKKTGCIELHYKVQVKKRSLNFKLSSRVNILLLSFLLI